MRLLLHELHFLLNLFKLGGGGCREAVSVTNQMLFVSKYPLFIACLSDLLKYPGVCSKGACFKNVVDLFSRWTPLTAEF